MKEVCKWNTLTNKLTKSWIREYFEIPLSEDVEYDWVGSEVGGIFEFADYFFSFADVLNCYKHNVTKHQLFNWYNWCLDNRSVNISLAKFILSPEERYLKEQIYLAELKDRAESAEKEFKTALERYDSKRDNK